MQFCRKLEWMKICSSSRQAYSFFLLGCKPIGTCLASECHCAKPIWDVRRASLLTFARERRDLLVKLSYFRIFIQSLRAMPFISLHSRSLRLHHLWLSCVTKKWGINKQTYTRINSREFWSFGVTCKWLFYETDRKFLRIHPHQDAYNKRNGFAGVPNLRSLPS